MSNQGTLKATISRAPGGSTRQPHGCSLTGKSWLQHATTTKITNKETLQPWGGALWVSTTRRLQVWLNLHRSVDALKGSARRFAALSLGASSSSPAAQHNTAEPLQLKQLTWPDSRLVSFKQPGGYFWRSEPISLSICNITQHSPRSNFSAPSCVDNQPWLDDPAGRRKKQCRFLWPTFENDLSTKSQYKTLGKYLTISIRPIIMQIRNSHWMHLSNKKKDRLMNKCIMFKNFS